MNRAKITIHTEHPGTLPHHTANPLFELWAEAMLERGLQMKVYDTAQNDHYELTLAPNGVPGLGPVR